MCFRPIKVRNEIVFVYYVVQHFFVGLLHIILRSTSYYRESGIEETDAAEILDIFFSEIGQAQFRALHKNFYTTDYLGHGLMKRRVGPSLFSGFLVSYVARRQYIGVFVQLVRPCLALAQGSTTALGLGLYICSE